MEVVPTINQIPRATELVISQDADVSHHANTRAQLKFNQASFFRDAKYSMTSTLSKGQLPPTPYAE